MMGGQPEVKEWEIAVLHRVHHAPEGACCRVLWSRGEPGRRGAGDGRHPHDPAVAHGGPARLLQRQHAGRPRERARRDGGGLREPGGDGPRARDGQADARGVHPADGLARSPRSPSSTSPSPTSAYPRRSDADRCTRAQPRVHPQVSRPSSRGRGRSDRAAGRRPGRRPAPARPARRSRRATSGAPTAKPCPNSRHACAVDRVGAVLLPGRDGEVPAVHQHLVQRDDARSAAAGMRIAGDLGLPLPRARLPARRRRARRAAAGMRVRQSGGEVRRRRPTARPPAATSPRPSGTPRVSPTRWSSSAATEVPAHGVGSVSWSSRTPATTRATSAAWGARSGVVIGIFV